MELLIINKQVIEDRIKELEAEYFRLKNLNANEADIQFLDGARTHVKGIYNDAKQLSIPNDEEIEKLAKEYHAKHCLDNKLPTDYYEWNSNRWIKEWWINSYKTALKLITE